MYGCESYIGEMRIHLRSVPLPSPYPTRTTRKQPGPGLQREFGAGAVLVVRLAPARSALESLEQCCVGVERLEHGWGEGRAFLGVEPRQNSHALEHGDDAVRVDY